MFSLASVVVVLGAPRIRTVLKGRGQVRIAVIVIPRARSERVEPVNATHFRVAVTEAPREDQANKAVIEALAEHFRVPRSRVRIVRGHTSRRKIVEVEIVEPE